MFLGCSEQVAHRLLNDPDELLFSCFEIPKRGRLGGTREVWEVTEEIIGDLYKGLARKLDAFLRSRLPHFPHNCAHAYVAGRSTLSNARVHLGASLIVNADIRLFFRSIGRTRILALFNELGLSGKAAAAISKVVVRDDHLPLGIPTSPLLANAVCVGLDERLRALVPGGRYTRYADDLSFSGPVLPSKAAVAAELEREGFQLSETKWRAARAGRGLYVTGLSLEDRCQPRVPKAMKRRLRQDLYHARERGLVAHLGARGYGSVRAGINQIAGLISYVRGIEPRIGSTFLGQWRKLLGDAGFEVAYASQDAAERRILFVTDESVIEHGGRCVMVLALVIVEDVDLVREASQNFLESLSSNPYGATSKEELLEKGLHWNAFVPDDRTRATEWVRALPFRCFLATATLGDQAKLTYDETYRRLLVKLVQGRLVRYDRCTIDLLVEQNSKVNLPKLAADVNAVYEKLARTNSRRPGAVPAIRAAAKLEEGALPLPDIVMGIFGDYARSAHQAQPQADAVAKKKRQPGGQAANRFEQVRDKIRAIYDLDTGEVYSRRRPFRPWQ